MTDISILVAVYNAEQYLHSCLQSLIEQSLKSIQIICIDDASTDQSLSILHSFAQRDNRIEVYSLTQNGGQAKARNEGLKHCKGKYICFVDSDDYLAPDALQLILQRFVSTNADVVLFDLQMTYSDRIEPYPMKSFETLTGEEAFVNSLTWAIHGVYAIKSTIHQQYPYDDTSKAYSDDNTTRIHYYQADIVASSHARYYYRQHAQSVTHASSIRRFDYLLANQSMKKQLLQLAVSHDILRIYENVRWLNLVDVYMYYYQHRKKLSTIERIQGLKIIQKTWCDIDLSLLNQHTVRKFGYMPLRWSWFLFRCQEEIYFFLRTLYYKIKS